MQSQVTLQHRESSKMKLKQSNRMKLILKLKKKQQLEFMLKWQIQLNRWELIHLALTLEIATQLLTQALMMSTNSTDKLSSWNQVLVIYQNHQLNHSCNQNNHLQLQAWLQMQFLTKCLNLRVWRKMNLVNHLQVLEAYLGLEKDLVNCQQNKSQKKHQNQKLISHRKNLMRDQNWNHYPFLRVYRKTVLFKELSTQWKQSTKLKQKSKKSKA